MLSAYIHNYQRVLGDSGVPEGNRWHFKCPFPGCYGYPLRKFNVDPETGAWHCYHCRHQLPWREKPGGAARDFAEALNDDPELWPTGIQDYDHERLEPLPDAEVIEIWTQLIQRCSLSDAHREEILRRGINPVAAGLVSVTPTAWRRVLADMGPEVTIRAGLGWQRETGEVVPTRCVQPGRLLIPFRDGADVVHFVGYQKCPPQHAGEGNYAYEKRCKSWVKIAGPRGYAAQIYGEIPKQCPLLGITEGQLKALAAIQRGLPFVGLQGAGQGHKELAKAIRLAKVQRVLVVFDNDRCASTHQTVELDAQRLCRALLQNKKLAVFRAELPLADDEDKTDIDSFLLRYGAEAFLEVLAAAVPCALEPPKPRKAAAPNDAATALEAAA